MMSFRLFTLVFALTLCIRTPANAQYVWIPKLQAGGSFSVSFNPMNPQTVYAGSGSLYVSYDAGEHWESLWDTSLSIIRFIAVDPVDSLKMYVGRTAGLWRTTDGGVSWLRVLTISFDGESIAIDPTSPNKLYVSGYTGGFHRSTDYGTTWALSPGTNTMHYCTIALRPDSTNILYTGSGGGAISKSTDHGLTWRQVHSSGSSETPKIVIDPLNPQVAYASHFGWWGGISKTTDGGETWFSSGLDSMSLWSLDIDRGNPSVLLTGEFYGTGEGRMFRSTNAGQTWAEDSLGFPQHAEHWMVKIIPVDTPLTIAAISMYCGTRCTDGGVFMFQPGNTVNIRPGQVRFPVAAPGDTVSAWVVIQNGPVITRVDSMRGKRYQYTFTPDSVTYLPFQNDSVLISVVYPSTPGYETDTIWIWSGDITDNPKRFRAYLGVVVRVAASNDLPDTYQLFQNYPNPFNPITTIRFEIPVGTRHVVSLRVFDVLGQEVATLVNEELNPGGYEVTWDASGIASGVYFYRLEAGQFVGTKKLLLLK